jgi:hypothetical protein
VFASLGILCYSPFPDPGRCCARPAPGIRPAPGDHPEQNTKASQSVAEEICRRMSHFRNLEELLSHGAVRARRTALACLDAALRAADIAAGARRHRERDAPSRRV